MKQGMKQDDSRILQILIRMHELLVESRLLQKTHDELMDEYVALKRERARFTKTRTAA